MEIHTIRETLSFSVENGNMLYVLIYFDISYINGYAEIYTGGDLNAAATFIFIIYQNDS